MTPAAALEALLKVSAERRKSAALRLLRRTIVDRVEHINTHTGPGRLVVEVICSAAASALMMNSTFNRRPEAVESLEWFADPEKNGAWFDLLELEAEPTVSLFFRLLLYVNIDKEVLRLWRAQTTCTAGKRLATSLLRAAR